MELNIIFIAEPLDKLKIATFFEQKWNKNRLFLLLLEGKDILAIISTNVILVIATLDGGS